jgi:drug/metabolite transporter (DMT)-like permease
MSTYRNGGLFVLLSILWGGSFVAIRVGLEYFPPALYAAIRYDIAALFMFGYAVYATDYWWPRTRADWLAVALDGVLVIGAYNAFLFLGERTVTSAVAAILIAVNPILATVIARAVLPDERLTRVGAAGLLFGFLGVALVARPNPAALLASDSVVQLLVLAAAASVALGSVLVQRVDDGIAAEGTTAWACLIGAALLHMTSLGLPNESLVGVQWTIDAVLAVGYLGVFASALGYFIYFGLLEKLGPIEINLISYATTVPAGVLGWVLLGETIDIPTAIGFGVIFGGFALLKRDALRAEVESARRSDSNASRREQQ